MTSYPGHLLSNEMPRSSGFGLALVVTLNGILLVRPEELYPPIAGYYLYAVAIICTTAYYTPSILREFSRVNFTRHPLLSIIIGLFASVIISHGANLQFGLAVDTGQEFAKLVLYYLIISIALTTLHDLQLFLTALLVFITIQTTMALLHYHGFVNIESLAPHVQWDINSDGEATIIARLCGSGIYSDPNDLCLLITAGMTICLNRAFNGGVSRLFWLLPTCYFGYALTLTQSRGGLLAAGMGFTAVLAAKFGIKRTLPIILLGLPTILILFAGRQTRIDLSSGEDTGQGRIQLWSNGFVLIQSHPLFGIGADQYREEVGMVAHNSYVQAYVELGLIGGGLFLSAFLLAVWGVWTTRPSPRLPSDVARSIAQIRPAIIGMLASYMAGMFSLSRDYVVPTYLNLALASAYIRLADPDGFGLLILSQRITIYVCMISIFGLICLKIFIAMFVQF